MSQEYKSFDISAVTQETVTEYHHLINHQTYMCYILTVTQQCVKSGHLSIFSIFTFKHLMMPLKCNFSGLYFYTLSKISITCRNIGC